MYILQHISRLRFTNTSTELVDDSKDLAFNEALAQKMADTRLHVEDSNTNRRWRRKIVSTSEGAGGRSPVARLADQLEGRRGMGRGLAPTKHGKLQGLRGLPSQGLAGQHLASSCWKWEAGSRKLELLQVSQLPARACICMTI